MIGYKTGQASAGTPTEPQKQVNVHNMHVQLKQEGDNRAMQQWTRRCTQVAARKSRLAAQVDRGSAEQPGKNDDVSDAILEETNSRERENTSVRSRTGSTRA